MSLFVGRQLELAVLRARLADAAAGQPRIVRIQGPAGIGKTALIEQFLREPGISPVPAIVRSSGEETESLLAHGVVEQLARSAAVAGAPLLESVAPGPAPVEDPVTVGARILELLDRIDGPAVLVVDDAHWADLPSLQALIFALRRLVADPVLTLVAVRDDRELPDSLRRMVSGHRGSELRLRGLDEVDLRDLADGLGIGLALPAAQRLRYGTQGNPLHARAPRSLRRATRTEREADCSTVTVDLRGLDLPAARRDRARSHLESAAPRPPPGSRAAQLSPGSPLPEPGRAEPGRAEPGPGAPGKAR